MSSLSKPTLVNKEAALAFATSTAKKLATEEASKRVFFAPEGHRRLTINVTHEMHKKLRLMAVEQDTTITDILTKLVAEKLG